MRFTAICLLTLTLMLPRAAVAQDADTLADIRQQLTVLYVEIQNLKRELSTTGAPSGVSTSGTTLDRVNAIEDQLRRLTGRTEQLENRVQSVVDDGTNRIGDLEFRLVELEGGDVSSLGETTTLGGDIEVPSLSDGSLTDAPTQDTELAVGEAADYQRAVAALDGGDFVSAETQFATFIDTYPGSPLAPEANLGLGLSLEGQNPTTNDARAAIARAFLESYSSDMNSAVADQALFHLGKSLAALGKTNEACVTLGEVSVRHPDSDMVMQAQSEMRNLGCP
ncbi:tetratricopeptide repeat protein [uncultured Shimia sp.]|uniref:tetratricopeptide repeat protein n=1 Tax=uncultured Shimia sp. TaxID=573152 RepID=UPI002607446E|nr:tetratricopeptide repeat protein [uncultured Shimia sp.]